MKAVIYARYSSDNQTEASIEGQLRECMEFAERAEIDVVGNYIDRALTAKTDNRPEFQRMIKDSYKHASESSHKTGMFDSSISSTCSVCSSQTSPNFFSFRKFSISLNEPIDASSLCVFFSSSKKEIILSLLIFDILAIIFYFLR